MGFLYVQSASPISSSSSYFHTSRNDLRKRYKSLRQQQQQTLQLQPTHVANTRHIRNSKEHHSITGVQRVDGGEKSSGESTGKNNTNHSTSSLSTTSVIGLTVLGNRDNSMKAKQWTFSTVVHDPFETGFTHYNVGVLLVSGTGSSFDSEKCSPAVDMALDIVNEVYLRPHKIKLHKVTRRFDLPL
jgi:hypothetical protein